MGNLPVIDLPYNKFTGDIFIHTINLSCNKFIRHDGT